MTTKGRKAFEKLIENIQIPEEIQYEFADTEVIRAYLDKVKGSLSVVFKHSQIIPMRFLNDFHTLLSDSLKEYKHIEIINRFPEELQEATLAEYWPLIIGKLKNVSGTFNLLDTAKWSLEGDKFKIYMASDSIRTHLLDKDVIQYLNESLFLWFETPPSVSLEIADKIELKKYGKLLKAELALDIKEMLNKDKTAATDVSIVDKSPKKQIYGKKITGEPQAIKLLQSEEDNVIITGRIFALELKDLKNNASIISIGITDNQDSIEAKLYNRNSAANKQLYELLVEDMWITVKGNLRFDKYINQLVLMISDIQRYEISVTKDTAKEKRIELHLHTNMSAMDGVTSVERYIERAKELGHEAIAITDHGVVQAYPDAYKYGLTHGVKIIYGLEANVLASDSLIVTNVKPQAFAQETFVVFDIETTGLSANINKIIEIGAVKIYDGSIIDRYSTFVNPDEEISQFISELTNISNVDLANAPSIKTVLEEFTRFIGDSSLVAYNSKFDIAFINAALINNSFKPLNNTIIDALALARYLYPNLKNHRLETICKLHNIENVDKHRAVSDAEATARLFILQLAELAEKAIDNIKDLNLTIEQFDFKKVWPFHVSVLVKNKDGLRNLYELVSDSHLKYFFRQPRIIKDELTKHRNGLLIGSGCAKGELIDALLNKTEIEIELIASYYDYLEVQPIGNYQYLLSNNLVKDQNEIIELIKKIIELGEKLSIPVIATGNVHYLEPEESVNRQILIHNQLSGARYHHANELYQAHYLTTTQMLEQFYFLDAKIAENIVVKNPKLLNNQIEELAPFPNNLHTPVIEGAVEEITALSYMNAEKIYGKPLPELVAARLTKELSSIIENGFAVIYLISHKLVAQSLSDGYLVGSRGSVGSSFVATMTEITEVNPLPPHYVCVDCRYSQFITDGTVESGYDLPDKICPKCGNLLKKDGHDIPFETFMGYKGDKVPDIDLNFSGEYQAKIHKTTEEIFGAKKVFRAGTISTVADKTAFGYVRKYVTDYNLNLREAEIARLAKGCSGVKRTTGQHPGGQIVIPQDTDVTEFTPIQRPADDQNSDVITTHFDYHALSGTLLKLDLLGHDDPTALKMLHDLTGVDPRSIAFDDPKLYQLFTSTEPLGLKEANTDFSNGAIGIPEFGTKFVRQMLDETRPTTFIELVRISGLSHGIDVWRNNAQDLIKRGEANLTQVICTRDDIMLYLIMQGLDSAEAFSISEKVRKGRGLSQDNINEMRKHSVPAWYIESCQKIKYMFPKAHAVAYVQMAIRIAYYKIYYPIEYYATYLSLRGGDFDIIEVYNTHNFHEKVRELNKLGNDATKKEKDLLTVLEVIAEMNSRGFTFAPIDLYKSTAKQYIIAKDKQAIIPPFSSIPGVGENLANNIVKAREQHDFISIEDFQTRCKMSNAIIEDFNKLGVLKGLNQSDQISLF